MMKLFTTTLFCACALFFPFFFLTIKAAGEVAE